MKTTLFILSLCFSLTVFAQSNLSCRKIYYGFSLCPELNYLKMGNLVGQESVAPRIGVSTALNVAFHFSNKISLRTGLGYGFKNYNHTHAGLIFGTDLNPTTGVNTTTTVESKITFSEFQIPLVFQYELKENKFFIAGGMEITKPFANQSERIVYYGNGTTDFLPNPTQNGLNFAPVFSIGYLLPVTDQLCISIEPMFKYYLKTYIVAGSNLVNYGLRTSIHF
jgi:Outer membrane protein beta-barrel domain